MQRVNHGGALSPRVLTIQLCTLNDNRECARVPDYSRIELGIVEYKNCKRCRRERFSKDGYDRSHHRHV